MCTGPGGRVAEVLIGFHHSATTHRSHADVSSMYDPTGGWAYEWCWPLSGRSSRMLTHPFLRPGVITTILFPLIPTLLVS